MPSKETTLATAEKRVIKAELTTLQKALRKVASDCRRARKVQTEIQRKSKLKLARLEKSESSLTTHITRRIAILEARL